MFENKKRIRAFIVMATLVLALILNGIFTLGSIRNNPVTAWQSQPVGNGTEYRNDYVVLEVLAEDANGNEISTSDGDDGTLVYAWLNVGRIQKSFTKDGYGVINLRSSASDSWGDSYLASSVTTVEIKKGVDTSKEEYQYSWYRTSITSFKKYWQVSTKDGLEINEIVFTNKDGNVLKTTLKGANVWKTLSSGVAAENYVNVEALEEDSKAFNVCDEQSLFQKYSSMSKKYNFTNKEADVVNTALSFLNVDGHFVDNTAGALGLELITLGMAVFGVNTLGVRIIPYIFFILTVLLIYVFGSKVFKNSDMGLLCAVLFTLLGLGLSVGSIGSVVSMTVFFSLLAVYFMYSFYNNLGKYVFRKDKHVFRASKMAILIPIILSALCFALAVNCSLIAVFVLPAVIAVFVFAIKRAKKIYQYNARLVNFEDEKITNDEQYKVNTVGTTLMFVIGYIISIFVLGLLFYAITGTTYTQYYDVPNLFTAIARNCKDVLFSGFNGDFIKWIVGGGSSLVYVGADSSNTLSGVYVSMNVFTQIISLISFVFVTIKVILANFVKKDGSGKELNMPYVVLALGYIFCWIMLAFVKNSSVVDYMLASAFGVCFIPFAYFVLKQSDRTLFKVKGKEVGLSCFAITLAIALSVVFFGLGYVMFAGIEVSALASKILFGWWLF